MRLNSALDDIWNSRLKTRLLRILDEAGVSFTGRRLAVLAGYSHTQTMTALADMQAQGLVDMSRVGNSYLFAINRENEMVECVLAPAFRLESELVNRLVDRYYDGLGRALVRVVLFGSAARGEEGPGSDVDLLLVVRDGTDTEDIEEKTAEISREVYRAFGCAVMPVLVTEAEYGRKLERREGFWREIPGEGRCIPPRRERERADQ